MLTQIRTSGSRHLDMPFALSVFKTRGQLLKHVVLGKVWARRVTHVNRRLTQPSEKGRLAPPLRFTCSSYRLAAWSTTVPGTRTLVRSVSFHGKGEKVQNTVTTVLRCPGAKSHSEHPIDKACCMLIRSKTLSDSRVGCGCGWQQTLKIESYSCRNPLSLGLVGCESLNQDLDHP